jgi:DNA polymerase V
MRAAGSAMREAGIDDGDVLLVDRALTPAHGNVVVAVVDGELVCRRLWKQGQAVRLQAANPDHAEIAVGGGEPLEIWGVVTTVIKSLLG